MILGRKMGNFEILAVGGNSPSAAPCVRLSLQLIAEVERRLF